MDKLTLNIKSIRESQRIIKAEMARRLDITPDAYHRIEERGLRMMVDQLQSIAKALDVPVDYIINFDPNVKSIEQAVYLSERTKMNRLAMVNRIIADGYRLTKALDDCYELRKSRDGLIKKIKAYVLRKYNDDLSSIMEDE